MFIYSVAAFFCLPVVGAALVLPVWLAWFHGHSNALPNRIVCLGLDFMGLYMLGVATLSVGWKFVAPFCVQQIGSTRPLLALIFASFWASALAGSSLCTISYGAQVLILPAAQDQTLFVFWAVSWFVLDATGSLMPAALLQPSAWCQAEPPSQPGASDVERPRPAAVLPYPKQLVPLLEFALNDPTAAAELLGLQVTQGCEIVTTQGGLAKLLSCSKATVNRQLHMLARTGRVELQVSAQETRIRLLLEVQPSPDERSGTFNKTR